MPSFFDGRRAGAAALVLAACCLAQAPVSAFNMNGFLRAKGKGDVAPSYSQESYDEFWVGTEKVSSPPELGEIETRSYNVWAAYGITDRLTLFATLPYVDAEGDGTAGMQQSDLQDLSVLAAYRVHSMGSKLRHQFVVGAGIRTPASNYEGDLPVSVGDGTTDGLFRFVYQLQTGRFYLSQQVGFNLRGEEAPNDFPLYTEVGYTFGRVTVNGFYDKLIANDGSDIGDPGFTFPGLREEYDRIGAKVYVRISGRWGIAVGAGTTLDGRNTGDSSGGSFGLDFSF